MGLQREPLFNSGCALCLVRLLDLAWQLVAWCGSGGERAFQLAHTHATALPAPACCRLWPSPPSHPSKCTPGPQRCARTSILLARWGFVERAVTVHGHAVLLPCAGHLHAAVAALCSDLLQQPSLPILHRCPTASSTPALTSPYFFSHPPPHRWPATRPGSACSRLRLPARKAGAR